MVKHKHMYSNGKIHTAFQIIDFFDFPPIGDPPTVPCTPCTVKCGWTNNERKQAVKCSLLQTQRPVLTAKPVFVVILHFASPGIRKLFDKHRMQAEIFFGKFLLVGWFWSKGNPGEILGHYNLWSHTFQNQIWTGYVFLALLTLMRSSMYRLCTTENEAYILIPVHPHNKGIRIFLTYCEDRRPDQWWTSGPGPPCLVVGSRDSH